MSSFVKHPKCKERCLDTLNDEVCCIEECFWLRCRLDRATDSAARPIFEERDTDEESKLDRRARARECKS